jgi:hypothetical protein
MHQSGFTVAPQRPDATHEGLLTAFEQRLRKATARNLVTDGDEIRFTGGVFRLVPNWNALVGITRGRIRIDRGTSRVAYCLSFTQLLIVATLMVGFLSVPAAVGGFSAEGVCAAALLWFSALYGLNRLITLARFDSFMKRCIRDAGFSVQRRKKEVASS